MKIIVDENIIFAKDAFPPFGEVILKSGREISNADLLNADALIVRSITKVDENLLKNTPVKFVGTATIGVEHLDEDYLNKSKIAYSSAKGCNSYAVTEYVFAALFSLMEKLNLKIPELTFGIIGCGSIGSKVKKLAEAIGFKVLVSDPPLQKLSNDSNFVSLDEVLKSDIITCHVPFIKDGEYKTNHLIDENKLAIIKNGSILINSSRGQVVDNQALKRRLQSSNKIHAVLDVWENEPNLDVELLNLVDLATPHVAGYSYEGKLNGTIIIHNKFCEFFQKNTNWSPPESFPTLEIDCSELTNYSDIFSRVFNSIYDIKKDTAEMKSAIKLGTVVSDFDKLRKNYNLRYELPNYKLKLSENFNFEKSILEIFRLKI